MDKKYSCYEIGEYTYGHPVIRTWGSESTLKVGKFCSIANNVTILLGGEHRIDWVSTYPFNIMNKKAKHLKGHPSSKGDVIIGNDCWIAWDALILSGVKIGDGAVIGAGSVVAKDVAPYSIVAGNPAKHVRFRFSELQIEMLQKIKWWNWSFDKIEANIHLLCSPLIDDLIEIGLNMEMTGENTEK